MCSVVRFSKVGTKLFYWTKHGHNQDFYVSKISKNVLLRKLRKMHYFSIFFKKVNKPCVKTLRLWTKNANCWEIFEKNLKIFDENSKEKLKYYFIFILENLLLKIEPSEITPFSTTFFRFRGGISPISALATPLG